MAGVTCKHCCRAECLGCKQSGCNEIAPNFFNALYDLPADETGKFLADDTALMLFGFRFLRQVLFGENSINLKTEPTEKRREQVQKMAKQFERETREKRAAEQDEMYGGDED